METKKDALMGVRLGAFSRIVACILSVVLVVGMVPSGAIAYAAEGDASGSSQESEGAGAAASGSADRVNQDVQLDTSGSASGSDSSGGSDTDSVTSSGDIASSSRPSEASGEIYSQPGEGSSATTKYTSSVSGQTSADVKLDGSATVGTIEYNGLAYTINTDDPETVSVTGLASTAPKGDLVIPAQIASGNKLYKVAKIVRGGGHLRQITAI